jgi:hypothetical protein
MIFSQSIIIIITVKITTKTIEATQNIAFSGPINQAMVRRENLADHTMANVKMNFPAAQAMNVLTGLY